MKIYESRIHAIAVLACALLLSGAARAQNPEDERASMCLICADEKACYNYAYGKPLGGACTYPPCSGTNKKGLGKTALREDLPTTKLICLACRAICENTPGGPGAKKAAKQAAAPTGEKKSTLSADQKQ